KREVGAQLPVVDSTSRESCSEACVSRCRAGSESPPPAAVLALSWRRDWHPPVLERSWHVPQNVMEQRPSPRTDFLRSRRGRKKNSRSRDNDHTRRILNSPAPRSQEWLRIGSIHRSHPLNLLKPIIPGLPKHFLELRISVNAGINESAR